MKQIQVRLPAGAAIRHRFAPNDTVQDLYDWVMASDYLASPDLAAALGVTPRIPRVFKLLTTMPVQEFGDSKGSDGEVLQKGVGEVGLLGNSLNLATVEED